MGYTNDKLMDIAHSFDPDALQLALQLAKDLHVPVEQIIRKYKNLS